MDKSSFNRKSVYATKDLRLIGGVSMELKHIEYLGKSYCKFLAIGSKLPESIVDEGWLHKD